MPPIAGLRAKIEVALDKDKVLILTLLVQTLRSDALFTDEGKTLIPIERPPCIKALVSGSREGHIEVSIETQALISEKAGSSRRRGEGEGAGVAEANWPTDPGNARFRPWKAQTLWTRQGG